MSNTEALRAAAHQALAAMEKYPVTVNHWKAVLLPAADALRAALAQQPAASGESAGVPFNPETWPVDADGFTPELCTVCGTPVRYGSRHSRCAAPTAQQEPKL